MWSGESANEYVCTGAKGRNVTGNNGDYNRYCIFDNEIDVKEFCNSDLFCNGYIQRGNMFTATKKPVVNKTANGVYNKKIIKPIYELKDPNGIKNGNFREIPVNQFNLNKNKWIISIKINLKTFNKNWQGIIGNMRNNILSTAWGLWVNPQRVLHWRIVDSTWDLYDLGILLDDEDYEINIKYNNGSYTFTLELLSLKIIYGPVEIKSSALITDKGLVTVGGDFKVGSYNEKFLGNINEIKILFENESIKESQNLCGIFITTPGNNLELLTTEIMTLFIKDYNGKYNKFKNFMEIYGQLKTVQSLDQIVKDNFEITNAKSNIALLTEKINQKSKELDGKDVKLNELTIELKNKELQLAEKVSTLNSKEKDLLSIKNALTLKEADFNKINGAIIALEKQNKEMQDSIVQKNELIKSVNDNIKQTQDKLNDYITQRDALNKQLNETKEKTDKEIKLAQDNYRNQLAKLAQDEKNARAKLEKDLQEQKKKDMDELTKVYLSREDALEKNFAVLKDSYVKAEEKNKIETKKLLDELELKKQQSEQEIKKFNQQIIDKQNELNVIKKQKDDDILKIQKETSDKIAKIREDTERDNANLIKKFEEEKKKSLDELTAIYDKREKQINDKLNEIQAQLLKAEQDNKIKIQNMINEYEKKKNDYEKALLDEYKRKDESYKKMADEREKQYQDALKKLQADNEAQSKKLNDQYQVELEKINKQKADMQKQFEDFKKKSEADITLITTKLNEEREIYNKEIARLNDLIKTKEAEAKQKLLDIQISLANDIKNLEAKENLKKELLFAQTNKQIEQALEELNSKKSDANKKFDEELKKKQSEFDKSLEDQKKDYDNRINGLQETNKSIISNLESLAQKYKLTQEEQNLRLKNLTEDKQKEYVKIQEEYDTKAKNEEVKFKELIKKLEDQKLQTITNFTKETEKELSRLNAVIEEQKAKNKIESDQKREELKETINKLEDEKIRLVQEKNAETKKALDKIQQMYDTQAEEIKKKLDEYNKLKQDNDKKLQDEMVIFNNNMKKLEEDKIKKVKDYTDFTKQELDTLGKNLEEQRLKAKADGLKYKKELEDTIEKLDKERMEIIKRKNDETASILNKIKQEYEKEVETVNKNIKEYNDKKKQYDINIKKIDEEQTAYVAKKRAESEEQLGKLSKMLTDEIESLKNKIEEHKVQRDIKLKEINELTIKLSELNKQYEIEEQRQVAVNKFTIISLSTIIAVLVIYIFYKRN
jgi:hypothetical protein